MEGGYLGGRGSGASKKASLGFAWYDDPCLHCDKAVAIRGSRL